MLGRLNFLRREFVGVLLSFALLLLWRLFNLRRLREELCDLALDVTVNAQLLGAVQELMERICESVCELVYPATLPYLAED